MDANSNTDFIRDFTEDVQSSVEETTSMRDIEERQQSENETNFSSSDSEYVSSDTDLTSDVEAEEERPNLPHPAEAMNANSNPDFIRDFTEDVQSSDEEVTSTDSADLVTDTYFTSDEELEEERPNLAHPAEAMNANSNPDFIRDFTEDVQSSDEEVTSTDSADLVTDTYFTSDDESEEERPNLAHPAEAMNANSNTNFILDFTEDIQSSVEEVTSTDSADLVTDTYFTSDDESEEERTNLASAAKVGANNCEHSTKTGRKQEKTYMPGELKKVFQAALDAKDIELIGEYLEQYPFLCNESYLVGGCFIFTVITYCDLIVLKKFIQAGLNVKLRGKDGQNILHYAVRYEKLEIVKYILDSQLIDINDTDTNINTPVHHACSLGKLESLKVLLKYDPDVTILNKEGLDCLGVVDSYRNIGGNKEQYIHLIRQYMEQREAARDIEEIQQAERKLVEVKLKVRLKNKEKKIAAIGHLIEMKSELGNKIDEYKSEIEAIQDKIKSIEEGIESVEKEIEEHSALEQEIYDLKKQLQEIRSGRLPSNRGSLVELSGNNSFIDDSDCPICCHSLKPPVKIYQCSEGHYFCEKCKRNHTMKRCPTVVKISMAKAFDVEF